MSVQLALPKLLSRYAVPNVKYAKIRSMEYTRGMYHDFMAKFGYTESVTHLLYRTTRSNP